MKIFVAYGYNPRDTWIEPAMKTLIEAFGSEMVDGKELAGQVITDEIQNFIAESDALIAFLTRRDDLGGGRWNSHPWVRDELTAALTRQKQVLGIVESGVQHDAGIAGRDRQYLKYDEAERVQCVVEIVRVLGRWHRRGGRRFQLLPNSLKTHLAQANYRCWYRTLEGNRESPAQERPVQRIQGGLFITIDDLSRESLVQVEVRTPAGVVASDYTPVDAVAIQITDLNS